MQKLGAITPLLPDYEYSNIHYKYWSLARIYTTVIRSHLCPDAMLSSISKYAANGTSALADI